MATVSAQMDSVRELKVSGRIPANLGEEMRRPFRIREKLIIIIIIIIITTTTTTITTTIIIIIIVIFSSCTAHITLYNVPMRLVKRKCWVFCRY